MTKEDLPDPSLDGDLVTGRLPTSSPGSERPLVYPVATAPMPTDCEFSFFDPNDSVCQAILLNPETTVSELFAVLRQWVPQVQQSIDVIGNEILKRGCQVNDRDGLTDMTLLHYTCKAGAQGVGDAEVAARFASQLISMGADASLRSRWTNMNALHYAAYFDVPELIRVVLKESKPRDVDATCSDFDFGTSLHIAASNLCLGAVKCLLEHGANPAFRDDKGQVAADVVPDPVDMPLEMADAAAVAKELKQLLLDAVPLACDISKAMLPNYDHISGKAMLMSLGLKLGDRVIIAGQKVGTLRFCGTTEFASGQWAGIDLDEAEGKNDGSVGGVQYFNCPPKQGIFAPLSKISKASERRKNYVRSTSVRSSAFVRSQKMDLSRVTSKVNTGLTPSKTNGCLDSKEISLSEETGPVSPGKEAFLPGSSCSSSSSSSLESKQPWQPFSCQRNLTRGGKRTNSTSTPLAYRTRAELRKRAPSVGSVQSDEVDIQVGDRVLVAGQRTGIVRFYGKTNFAPGFWYGVELDKPSGKNDGSVRGVQYFTCTPQHGVFAPPSRVQRALTPKRKADSLIQALGIFYRMTGSLDCLSDIPSNKLNHSFPGFRRSYSSSSAMTSQKEVNRKNSFNKSKSSVFRQSWSNTSGGSTELRSVKLHEGSQVLLTSSNEMAIIRYVGSTDFAPGVWLGLELRSPKGKNDGSVGEKRYFSCKPNHGVLVRPSRVTYRGINGSKLVDDC
ncbi:CAP-Gly domain-containing linker protein 4 isoform X1 [Latimeria chalumnae]|uniref:CAP-Gly domain-containing linker protein 4 isoform X1 n=1 Tax=Latimeria chalumnae TaxID=7897 RepID=UPI0003C10E74|nr:PREDICTED: CAP-Gly domain-containing linker protein 4 isoform X1 [Latimeria chalumnae]XP_005995067.1 PREDICTED: CAP-Gly domain-containing linker protein 4 isoform X1 [Latimeria chalumnae]|eukprot:XP_005995066.1 PREDICTED: CAP-Gly domain-containing linker protein 4 isoform X1 [Latimeria chalumnae]